MTDKQDVLVDKWIPENHATTDAPSTPEPLVEREWAGAEKIQKYFVRVRLNDVGRTREWREVEAETLGAAVKVAEAMDDVEVCSSAVTATQGLELICTENPGQVAQFDGNANLLAMGGLGPQGDVT